MNESTFTKASKQAEQLTRNRANEDSRDSATSIVAKPLAAAKEENYYISES